MTLLSLLNMPNGQAYCQKITHLSSFNQQVDCLRLDKLHPIYSGNKPLKLQGWLQAWQLSSYRRLLSFGGAHSNHLHALAYAGYRLRIPVVLVVRAYEQQPLTPTLRDCVAWGAQLIFADKKTYAQRYCPNFQQQLARQHDALVIGEGGSATAEQGALGEQGCHSLALVAAEYDEVWLAVGSGTTALGIANAWQQLGHVRSQLVGVNAVADQGERERAWQQQMPASIAWHLWNDEHLGGFAKTTPELNALIERYQRYGLPLEPVYSAKLVRAFERHQPQCFASKVLLIHGGGLQGTRGYAINSP